MRDHIQSLTPLRGYAALFVVIHHFITLRFPDLNNLISTHTSLVDNAYLMVDLFFILSGFVLAHVYTEHFSSTVNRPSYGKFMFSRFARIYPLHLFILFGFIGLELLHTLSWLSKHGGASLLDAIGTTGAPFSGSRSLESLAANLFLVQSWTLDPRFTSWNHPSWSLSSEWFAYLLVPFLLIIVAKLLHFTNRSKTFYPTVIAAITLPLAVLFGISISTQWGLDVAGLHGLIRCVMEAWLGMIAYQVYRHGHLKKLWRQSALMLFFLLWIVAVMWTDANDTLAIPGFFGLILCASYNSGLMARFLNTKINIFLGNISYSIYMTHIFVMQLIVMLWPKIIGGKFGDGLNTDQSLGLLSMTLIAVVLTSILTYKFVELPAKNWLKKQYQKRY